MPSPSKQAQSITATLQTSVFSSTITTAHSRPTPHPKLVGLATSLYSVSLTRAPLLKREEEIARECACCVIAAERLSARMNLPKIDAKPPCPPRMFKKLIRFLGGALAEVGATSSDGPRVASGRAAVTPKSAKGGGASSAQLLTPASTPSRKRSLAEATEAGASPSTDKNKRQRLDDAPPTPTATPRALRRLADAEPETPCKPRPQPPSAGEADLMPAWVAPTALHLANKFSLPPGSDRVICSGITEILYPSSSESSYKNDLDPLGLSSSRQLKLRAQDRGREKRLPAVLAATVAVVRSAISTRKSGNEVDVKPIVRIGVQELVAKKVVTALAFGVVVTDAMEVVDELREALKKTGEGNCWNCLRGLEDIVLEDLNSAPPAMPTRRPPAKAIQPSVEQERNEPESASSSTRSHERLVNGGEDSQEDDHGSQGSAEGTLSLDADGGGQEKVAPARPAFTHPSVDWLSPDRCKQFANWKVNILRRIRAIEWSEGGHMDTTR